MVSSAQDSKKAVVLLPHWNAPADGHNALCRGLARLGISALRISLPYHDYRMPAELKRADYAVSSNICRTMDAARQAVIDVRCCFDWLQSQGYERLGIVGTSLGSAYACLVSAHDERISVNVFNHCSTYVADVVWAGLSTQHVRQGLEEHIDLDRLRRVLDGGVAGELHGKVRGQEAEVAVHLHRLRYDLSAGALARHCGEDAGTLRWITKWWCCRAATTRWVRRRSNLSTAITSVRI